MSWKTVYINQDTKVSLELNAMKIFKDNEYIKVNISDINTVIFAHVKMQITIPLICKLIEENINVLITDERQDPVGIFLPFNKHSLVFTKLSLQTHWKQTLKKKLWKEIVIQKIDSEINAIKMTTKDDITIKRLSYLKNNVQLDDKTNREGMAAKVYYKSIFESNFIRFNDDAINFALNYGYKIMASHISRVIASRGYVTQIGIHHIGESNAFNLTYDFIEIYRYAVDIWVYFSIKEDFGIKERHELMNLLNWKITIDNKREYLANAIEKTVDSYFKYLSGEDKLKIPIFNSIRYDED